MKAQFSFSNKDKRTITLPIVDIDTNQYAVREDEPETCTIVNTTTAIDQPELITYQCGTMNKVPSKVTNLYPPQVPNAVQYGVRLDELLRLTTDAGEEICDLPITATLTFRHPSNAAVTAAVVEELLQRLIGALYKSETETRINDMMRLAIRP